MIDRKDVCNILRVCVAGSVPEIIQHPLNTTVVRGNPLTLDCRASGSPRPIIEWYKDGQLVKTSLENPELHRIQLPDGNLFFLRAVQSKKEQDEGTYWCVASNSEGVARSNNATLEIACKFFLILLARCLLYYNWNHLKHR